MLVNSLDKKGLGSRWGVNRERIGEHDGRSKNGRNRRDSNPPTCSQPHSHWLSLRTQHAILSEPAGSDIHVRRCSSANPKHTDLPTTRKRTLLTKQEGTERCGAEGQSGPLLRGGSDYITQLSETRTEGGLIAARSAIPFFSWNDPAGASESDR